MIVAMVGLTPSANLAESKNARIEATTTGHPVTEALEPPDEGLDARTILRRTVAQLNGLHNDLGSSVWNGPLMVAYERKVFAPNQLTVAHLLYRWSPDAARLELFIKAGEGRDSVSLVSSTGAWVMVDGRRVEVNSREIQGRIQAYGVENLYRVHLTLSTLVERTLEGKAPQYMGVRRSEGGWTEHVITMATGQSNEGVAEITIETGRYRVRSVNFRTEQGLQRTVFNDFRITFPGVELPWQIALWKAEVLQDLVQVKRLEVLARPAQEMLEPEIVRSYHRKRG